MGSLQATWTDDGQLFFWTPTGELDEVVATELPTLANAWPRPTRHQVAWPQPALRRRSVEGLALPVDQVLPLLCDLRQHPELSDALRCWSLTAWLAIDLAARQRVKPVLEGDRARWRALLAHRADRGRVDALARALPPAARALPVESRGAIRLWPAHYVVRAFLDACVDALYRTDTHAGVSRGWPTKLAEALRGEQTVFNLHDARLHALPQQLQEWARDADADALTLCLALDLPDSPTGTFRLSFHLHAADTSDESVPLDDAWYAGHRLQLGERSWLHPAHVALRSLARAARTFAPLAEALRGPRPSALRWDAPTTWRFLSYARPLLEEQGIAVRLPDAFSDGGTQRIRTRVRLSGPQSGPLQLEQELNFRWEITLGGDVVEGERLTQLLAQREPIARFDGQWVLLDPSELARLPNGLPAAGRLPAVDALRAALVGWHHGAPVVADASLERVLGALRSPPTALVPVAFKGRLRPYQKLGLSWLSSLGSLGLGACLADDMGLGKTVQLIAHILRRHERQSQLERRPTLIVCPTSVLGNWERELLRFGPSLGVLRYHGPERQVRALRKADVVLTTYSLLVRDYQRLKRIDWDVLALDEAQSIKNPDSRRAKCARGLQARHRVALTGTPVENRLDELWSLMHFLVPGLLGSRARFRAQVALPIERYGDQQVTTRLRSGIAPFVLRRLKTDPDVITDLPEKIERTCWTPLGVEQAQLYQRALDERLASVAGHTGVSRHGHVLALLTSLKQICNHPSQYLGDDGPLEHRSGKLERCGDLLDAILTSGERALIFTQYRQLGDRLVRWFQERYRRPLPFLHGGTAQTARDELVRRFQEDDDAPPILLISLRAGGTGLNLTRATHVIHYDRWWNPAVEDQATDRAFRIGQHHNVQVHKLVTQGTLEERIDALLEDKRKLAEQVLGNGESWLAELDDDALRQLVELGDDALIEEEV